MCPKFFLATTVALLMTFITDIAESNQIIDLSGGGCDGLESGYSLPDEDTMLTIQHAPSYNSISTRDRCDVVIRAQAGRRIQWIIETIQFSVCGVEITLYDNPTAYVNPFKIITCDDKNAVLPLQGKTNYNVLRIQVRKPTSASRAFTFSMRVKDDRGPPLEFLATAANYLGEGLEPGVVVGIGLAGAILIIALVLLAIYLCIRARKQSLKEAAHMYNAESSVYTSGTSQQLFGPGAARHPRGRYGSMEDIRSTASSQQEKNGTYANPAYTTGPREKESKRSASLGRARGKGVANSAYSVDSEDGPEMNRGSSERRSRRDNFEKPLKSAMKKRSSEELEMGRVSSHPNGILKRATSPSRSQTSSVEGSFDLNNIMYGYNRAGGNTQLPNVHHKPVIERRRSRSGTRSQHSSSSLGRASSKDRNRSSDRKKNKPPKNSRMFNEDVFIDPGRSRSGSRSRGRSGSLRSRDRRSDRYSEADSESSAPSYTSSNISKNKVSLNPGGKRVQIKGTETDF